MKLTIVGGGGFRTPLVVGALAGRPLIDEVWLYDIDPARLATIEAVVEQQSVQLGGGPRVVTTTELDPALSGADVVFSAIRVGGLRGRTCDERVALDLGVLGQETTGPGGIAFGLRTIPVVMRLAERMAALSPDAWLINFTNPAGMITQALGQVLGDRVIGICDSPVGLGRRAARALGIEAPTDALRYSGLNHLGWLHRIVVDGRDVLPELLADEARLLTTEEGRLFGPGWLADLGAIPNEYLYYYYFTREALAALSGGGQTRGEFLLRQQRAFYEMATRRPDSALEFWHRSRRQREETYLAEARTADESRDERDLSGGYEGVALSVMTALATGEPATLILNVPGRGVLAGLPDDAVVEVPAVVNASGAHPLPADQLSGHQAGLVAQIKEVEAATIEAATTRSRRLARKAFALHPLVDSVSTADHLLDGYRAAHPELDYFGPRGATPAVADPTGLDRP